MATTSTSRDTLTRLSNLQQEIQQLTDALNRHSKSTRETNKQLGLRRVKTEPSIGSRPVLNTKEKDADSIQSAKGSWLSARRITQSVMPAGSLESSCKQGQQQQQQQKQQQHLQQKQQQMPQRQTTVLHSKKYTKSYSTTYPGGSNSNQKKPIYGPYSTTKHPSSRYFHRASTTIPAASSSSMSSLKQGRGKHPSHATNKNQYFPNPNSKTSLRKCLPKVRTSGANPAGSSHRSNGAADKYTWRKSFPKKSTVISTHPSVSLVHQAPSTKPTSLPTQPSMLKSQSVSALNTNSLVTKKSDVGLSKYRYDARIGSTKGSPDTPHQSIAAKRTTASLTTSLKVPPTVTSPRTTTPPVRQSIPRRRSPVFYSVKQGQATTRTFIKDSRSTHTARHRYIRGACSGGHGIRRHQYSSKPSGRPRFNRKGGASNDAYSWHSAQLTPGTSKGFHSRYALKIPTGRRPPKQPMSFMQKRRQTVLMDTPVLLRTRYNLVKGHCNALRSLTSSRPSPRADVCVRTPLARRIRSRHLSTSLVNVRGNTSSPFSCSRTPAALGLKTTPTSLTRKAASHALQRSIYVSLTAKQRGKKQLLTQRYCMFYNLYGRCKRGDDCPYVHDPEKIAVCTRFLRGTCPKTDGSCLFSHKVSQEKMPVCSYFLRGVCNRDSCPYSHVKVSSDAVVCPDFIKGYCSKGKQCKKKHTMRCVEFTRTGRCKSGTNCPMLHKRDVSKRAKTRSKPLKRLGETGNDDYHDDDGTRSVYLRSHRDKIHNIKCPQRHLMHHSLLFDSLDCSTPTKKALRDEDTHNASSFIELSPCTAPSVLEDNSRLLDVTTDVSQFPKSRQGIIPSFVKLSSAAPSLLEPGEGNSQSPPDLTAEASRRPISAQGIQPSLAGQSGTDDCNRSTAPSITDTYDRKMEMAVVDGTFRDKSIPGVSSERGASQGAKGGEYARQLSFIQLSTSVEEDDGMETAPSLVTEEGSSLPLFIGLSSGERLMKEPKTLLRIRPNFKQ